MKVINLSDEDYNDLISCLCDHRETGWIDYLEKSASNDLSYQEAILVLEKWGKYV